MVSCSLLKISAHFRSLYFLAWAFRVLRGKCIRPRERKSRPFSFSVLRFQRSLRAVRASHFSCVFALIN